LITIGVDAHKRVHVALALDDAGREVASWKGANSADGWCDFTRWAAGLGPGRQIGIEGAWSYGRGLAQHLVRDGEAVYEVNSRWTALGRRSAMKRDKTDRLDARAVALFVRQEAANLPPVAADDETAVLDLFAVEREAAIGEATRLRNQIHALLMQLDPEYQRWMPTLKSAAGLAALQNIEASDDCPISKARAQTVRRLAERLALALRQADEVGDYIRAFAAEHAAPLTELCGVNLLTAGTLAGILGPGRRFASDAALASYAGASPLEASSAGQTRHRLNRGGHRRLNAVLYRIAITQAHHSSEARAYLARRVTEGKTRREAMRALKRFIARAIWRLWNTCPTATPRALHGGSCT
jgi:transposase